MARFIVPKTAIRGKGKLGKLGKWHLVKPGAVTTGTFQMSVCKRIFWEDSECRAEALVSALPAKDICGRCLGPLEVED